MREATSVEALASLRQLVKSLEGGAKIIRQGADVTKAELRLLRLEISYLEKSLANEQRGAHAQSAVPSTGGGVDT
jgi:hypothetical protein